MWVGRTLQLASTLPPTLQVPWFLRLKVGKKDHRNPNSPPDETPRRRWGQPRILRFQDWPTSSLCLLYSTSRIICSTFHSCYTSPTKILWAAQFRYYCTCAVRGITCYLRRQSTSSKNKTKQMHKQMRSPRIILHLKLSPIQDCSMNIC